MCVFSLSHFRFFVDFGFFTAWLAFPFKPRGIFVSVCLFLFCFFNKSGVIKYVRDA